MAAAATPDPTDAGVSEFYAWAERGLAICGTFATHTLTPDTPRHQQVSFQVCRVSTDFRSVASDQIAIVTLHVSIMGYRCITASATNFLLSLFLTHVGEPITIPSPPPCQTNSPLDQLPSEFDQTKIIPRETQRPEKATSSPKITERRKMKRMRITRMRIG